MKKWKCCIVEESLDDNRILNEIETIKIRVTAEQKPEDRWHIYNALATEKEIEKIQAHLKNKWYVHFWKDNDMIILFKGKRFRVDALDKNTWKEAVEYGLSVNIPREQLDFLMEF